MIPREDLQSQHTQINNVNEILRSSFILFPFGYSLTLARRPIQRADDSRVLIKQ